MENKSIDWFLYDRYLRHKRDKNVIEKAFGKIRPMKITEINETAILRLLSKSELVFLLRSELMLLDS